MPLSERILMGPGPCNPYLEVVAAMGRPMLGHLDPEFGTLLDETGVRSDIDALAAGKGDALLLVDCVTSLGGIPFDADGWGIDIAYSGTQKCLGVPPGLAPLTLNERARARRNPSPQSWYLDLGML